MRNFPPVYDILRTACAFAHTRWLVRRLRTRDDIRQFQTVRLERMLRTIRTSIDFYRNLDAVDISQLPVTDKQLLLKDFHRFNRPGLTVDQIRQALARGENQVDGYAIGQSTGTSGNRGYYVISDAERFTWLGVILAKTLPDALWHRHRVALALPGLSSLYQSASRGSRIELRFFDLADGVDALARPLAAFAPDTIVAPPRVLRRLAETGSLHARHIFSGAEVLDPADRTLIEEASGQRVREIYMATEGLFGVACKHGTLHLAEDVMAFEWQPVAAGGRLLTPLITDFTRKVQAMVRYRMNDLLDFSDEACPCGSPMQAVRRIEGRCDDIFLLPHRAGGPVMVTPDVLRNAVVDADPRITDFRINQCGAAQVEVCLDPSLAPAVALAVTASLRRLFDRLQLGPLDIVIRPGLDLPPDRKLRRVQRLWRPG